MQFSLTLFSKLRHMEDKTHYYTRSWRNADRNWAGEEKRKGKRKERKGARDGDMKEKIIPCFSTGLFH
jgi:hypothetical protein